jgi:hypothetical protein
MKCGPAHADVNPFRGHDFRRQECEARPNENVPGRCVSAKDKDIRELEKVIAEPQMIALWKDVVGQREGAGRAVDIGSDVFEASRRAHRGKRI